jgi:hypothetical protein
MSLKNQMLFEEKVKDIRQFMEKEEQKKLGVEPRGPICAAQVKFVQRNAQTLRI